MSERGQNEAPAVDLIGRMVYIDGAGDRYRIGPVVVRQWLQSEKTGALVEVSDLSLRCLAVELDGKLVKPLTTPTENYG